VSEADFFRAITAKKVLEKLADTYPSPCQKHDVPLWVYIAGTSPCAFTGPSVQCFPLRDTLRRMINAFGLQWDIRPRTRRLEMLSLSCLGSTIRMSMTVRLPAIRTTSARWPKRTDAELLTTWFNRDVTGIFKQHHAFDPQAYSIGDASYLFVPDNASL